MGWFEWAFFYAVAGLLIAVGHASESSGLWVLRTSLFWPVWIARSLPRFFFHTGLAIGRMARAEKIDEDYDPDALTGNTGTM